jgi:hypothetical protein
LGKKRKHEQVEAENAKAEENKRKEQKRDERNKGIAAALEQTSKNLSFNLEELTNMSPNEQSAQIAFWHHYEEKQLKLSKDRITVKAKSHYTNQDSRMDILKKAVELYRERFRVPAALSDPPSPVDVIILDEVEYQADEEL